MERWSCREETTPELTAVIPEEQETFDSRIFPSFPEPPEPVQSLDDDRVAVPEGDAVRVRLDIYDIRGRRVRTLLDEERLPGRYTVHWDGRDNRGGEVGTGLYLHRFEAGSFSSVRKMTVLR